MSKLVVPLIVCGHTKHPDNHTIVDCRNNTINVINNVELCKKNNPNTIFYTIYSIDDSINSQAYFDYFDVVIYSENIPHPYVGEKVKVESALNHIISKVELEWRCFVKIVSRVILNNIEKYLTISDEYDYIGGHHQTNVQYKTVMFIGNKKLSNVWSDLPPRIELATSIKTEKDWLALYQRNLLENLFYDCCKKHNVRSLIIEDGLYYFEI